jgi:hypothetical protein
LWNLRFDFFGGGPGGLVEKLVCWLAENARDAGPWMHHRLNLFSIHSGRAAVCNARRA